MAGSDKKSLWELYKGQFKVGGGEMTAKAAADQPINDMLDAAKDQITMLTALFTGGYLAIFSISSLDSIKAAIGDLSNGWKLAGAILIALPMIFWLISLLYANLLYHSALYNNRIFSIGIKKEGDDYRELMRSYLGRSQWCMIAGLVVLLVILLVYVIVPVATEPTMYKIQMVSS